MSGLRHSEVRGVREPSDIPHASASFDPDARLERSSAVPAQELRGFSPDERVEWNGEHHGGAYKDVFVPRRGEDVEVHHMPANEVNGLEFQDGPTISMDKPDHRLTGSCGMTTEAREYRAQQRELIEAGDFKGAIKMDIDDIHSKFGDKYDGAIQEMLDYAEGAGFIPDQEGLME